MSSFDEILQNAGLGSILGQSQAEPALGNALGSQPLTQGLSDTMTRTPYQSGMQGGIDRGTATKNRPAEGYWVGGNKGGTFVDNNDLGSYALYQRGMGTHASQTGVTPQPGASQESKVSYGPQTQSSAAAPLPTSTLSEMGGRANAQANSMQSNRALPTDGLNQI